MTKRYDVAAEKAREALEELRLAAYEQGYADAKHDLTAVAPATRDEIVAKAKRDVDVLLENAFDGDGHEGDFPAVIWIGHVKFEFVVNSEKRTVVALGYMRYEEGGVVVKGIAKCDPTDCFNAHIGKAIALRRALGLEVPAEYLNAPQPTEVRVGDIVGYPFDPDDDFQNVVTSMKGDGVEYAAGGFDFIEVILTPDKDPIFDLRIIDDTRAEVAE